MGDEIEYDITPANLDSDTLKRVGTQMYNRFCQYKKDRRDAEKQWLRNLRQYQGEYDPEVKIDDDKSRAYPKLTRMKVVGMVSKLMSMLFPEGEENWSVEASARPSVDQETLQYIIGQWALDNPDANLDLETLEREVKVFADAAAERMSLKIRDQLSDAAEYGQTDYPTLARKVIQSAVKYSMGVLKGPMTVEDKGTVYRFEDGQVILSEETRYRPYFEFVRLWDYYPDMNAPNFAGMDGQFQRHVFSKHQLIRLAEREDFFGEAIRQYLENNPDGNYRAEEHEQQIDRLEGSHAPNRRVGSKFEVIEYWGSVYASDLRGMGEDIGNISGSKEIKGTVWLIDETVIKAARDPFPEGAAMYHQFVFEEDDVNLCGAGLPPIMRDSQMGAANAARMLLDNGQSVCGPMTEVNIDRLAQRQANVKVAPFETVYTEGTGAEATAPAIRDLSFNSHITELLAIFNVFKSMADEETFVSATTTGGTEGIPGEAMRTQGNASMILGNAALPFRDIVRNYDAFTVSVIHSLIQWNRIFDPETNIDGDLRPLAKGSTSLMAKEVRAYALDNLATTLTDDEKPYIDMAEMAKARVSVRDLPAKLILPPERAQQNLAQQQQSMEQQQQLAQQQAEAEIRKTNAQAAKDEAAAQENQAEAEVERLKLGQTQQQGQMEIATTAAEAEADIATTRENARAEQIKAQSSIAQALAQQAQQANAPEEPSRGV